MQWYRAIGIEQLVGSIGGYVGLCLGFSIAQIPELIICMVIFIKKEYQKEIENTNRISMTGISVVVENTSKIMATRKYHPLPSSRDHSAAFFA